MGRVLIDTLITSAPWRTAQAMPAAIRPVSGGYATGRLPVLSSSWNTRTGRIFACGAAPTRADFLSPSDRAAMMPATPVPCPRMSSVAGPGTNDTPGRTAPRRCALPGSTPESTTATVTPLPVASVHEGGTPRAARAYDELVT